MDIIREAVVYTHEVKQVILEEDEDNLSLLPVEYRDITALRPNGCL